MENKPNCGCGCGGKNKFRLGLFAAAIVILAAVGASQLVKDAGPGKNTTDSNATQGVSQENTQDPIAPFTLDPVKVNEAELIPVNIASVNISEIGGETFRTITLVPQAEWQGDFTAERIAATLFSACKPNSSGVDVVEVYLLPANLESEAMLDEAKLGKLVMEAEKSPDNELLVMTRGYLPQELEFIKLWDEMWPEFMGDNGLDRSALTQAVIEKIGFDAYGMEYPFMDAERIENLPALINNYGK